MDDASAASERLQQLEAVTRMAGENLFARNIEVLRLELDTWRAHVEEREDSSVALMREAAELEAAVTTLQRARSIKVFSVLPTAARDGRH